ncbi:MAG: hypothetical protein ACOZQL_10615 [Myxococcota bacterium]
MVPSPPPPASDTRTGLLSHLAQAIGGVKTFASLIIASAGLQVESLFNSNGTGAGDVCVKVGTSATAHANAKLVSVREQIGGGGEAEIAYFQKTLGLVVGSAQVQPSGLGYFPIATYSNQFRPASANAPAQVNDAFGGAMTGASDIATKLGTTTADASVNSAAKLLSVRTGLGGTEVEKLYVDKAGDLWTGGGVAGQGIFRGAGNGNQFLQCDTVNGVRGYVSGLAFTLTGSGFTAVTGGAGVARFAPSARLDQSGTDSSGTPGSRTGANAINKPSGKSAIAAGATTCQIDNSLVAAGDQVFITWHGDLGTQSKVPWVTTAAGSFTVNVGTAPAGAVAFCWAVQKRI